MEKLKELINLKNELIYTPVDQIIKNLSLVKDLWRPGGPYYLKATEEIKDNEYLKLELEALVELLDLNELKNKIKAEFFDPLSLDRFVINPKTKIKLHFAPLGTILHISSGNTSLAGIDSLIMGLLTKNINLVKLSSRNNNLLKLFCESLNFLPETKVLAKNCYPLKFKGGNKEIQGELYQLSDAVVCWGGQYAIEEIRKEIPSHCKLIEHGPKISFHVISKKAYISEDVNYSLVLKDILTLNQQACASSQNIFLEEGIDANEFNQKLLSFYLKESWDRTIATDDQLDLLNEHYEGLYQEFCTGVKAIKADGLQLQYDTKILSPSALNGSVNIKHYENVKKLGKDLKSYRSFLQSCGLIVSPDERPSYLTNLARSGVKRFTRAGEMLVGKTGAPHDGNFLLQQLTEVCADEACDTTEDLLAQKEIPFFEKYKKANEYPLIGADNFKEDLLYSPKSLLAKNLDNEGGYFFASGGTTGQPKYTYYSYTEFEEVARMLAYSYERNGLESGMVVANLFMAGNMWSSFSAVQKALGICRCIQLPIGGLVNSSDFVNYVKYFKVKVIFGLPSLLLNLCQQTSGLKIETVFYAGETFSESAKAILEKNWNTKRFISAGYASVDVGPIGYQDDTCVGTEHYLFDNQVKLEVIDGEGVVTSLVRKNMPVIRYRTGDKIELLPSLDGRTKFKLCGRVDKKINIWGSRFEFNEVNNLLKEESLLENIQLKLTSELIDGQLWEYLEVHYEGILDVQEVRLKEILYNNLSDVRNTVDFKFFNERIKFINQSMGQHPRTGKELSLLDARS